MRLSIAILTVVACVLGAVATGILFAQAARAPNNDWMLEQLVSSPNGWIWAIAPYAALAAVAVAFRRRTGASLLVLCVALPIITFCLMDTKEYMRPLPPGTHKFARGLGYGTPIPMYFAAAALPIAIKTSDWLQRLINPSPCRR
jgi:hypothetical protein